MATQDNREERSTKRTYKSSDVHKRRVGDTARSKPAKMPTRREARESARETMRISAASRSDRAESEDIQHDEETAANRSTGRSSGRATERATERPRFVVIKNETAKPAEGDQTTVRISGNDSKSDAAQASTANAVRTSAASAANASRTSATNAARSDAARPTVRTSAAGTGATRTSTDTAIIGAPSADAGSDISADTDSNASKAQGDSSIRSRLGTTLKLDQATKLIQRINPANAAKPSAPKGGDAQSAGPVTRVAASLTPKKKIAIIAAFAILILCVALFAFNRWGRYDDRVDIQGTWYVLGTEVPVTIEADVIRIDPNVAYQYEIDTREKTIKFSFGQMEGQGRYWFSADRKYLVITDGEGYTAASTTVDDLIHAFLDFSTAAGGGVVELPQGDKIIAFSRSPEPLVTNPPAEGLVVEKPDNQTAQSGQSAASSDEASRSSESAESSETDGQTTDDGQNGYGQSLDEGYYGGATDEGSANGSTTYDESYDGAYYDDSYYDGSYYDETYYGEPTYDETAIYDEEEAV